MGDSHHRYAGENLPAAVQDTGDGLSLWDENLMGETAGYCCYLLLQCVYEDIFKKNF